jgi:hypothetical protein
MINSFPARQLDSGNQISLDYRYDNTLFDYKDTDIGTTELARQLNGGVPGVISEDNQRAINISYTFPSLQRHMKDGFWISDSQRIYTLVDGAKVTAFQSVRNATLALGSTNFADLVLQRDADDRINTVTTIKYPSGTEVYIIDNKTDNGTDIDLRVIGTFINKKLADARIINGEMQIKPEGGDWVYLADWLSSEIAN